jgi:predicted  nucleic acid-binding Zn-ribbon protein
MVAKLTRLETEKARLENEARIFGEMYRKTQEKLHRAGTEIEDLRQRLYDTKDPPLSGHAEPPRATAKRTTGASEAEANVEVEAGAKKIRMIKLDY